MNSIPPAIYLVGNPLVQKDRGAVELLPALQKKFPNKYFSHYDPTEDLPDSSLAHLILIDVVLDIKKVTVYTSLADFATSPQQSVHDFDLPLQLGILQKLGKLKKITIIGVPQIPSKKDISQLFRLISST